MKELLAHLFGDFAFQHHGMATRKRASTKWAAIHATVYCLPFLYYLRPSLIQLAIIGGTHFLIDRFGLAGYWVRFYGVGCQSRFTGPVDPAPLWLAQALLIIVDNTIHLAVNHEAMTRL